MRSADVTHRRDVVRDEHVGQRGSRCSSSKQIQDLRADRDVERADRLVADDQVRLERERARDADALALAARELVRIAAHELRIDADLREQRLHLARAAPSPRARPKICSGSPTISSTVMRGSRLAYGS